MRLRKVNYFLLLVCLVLLISLFLPLKFVVDDKDLGCSINGNYIEDVNLCCYDMQKFSSCENGRCSSLNYEILSDKKTLKYCKRSGYDVKF